MVSFYSYRIILGARYSGTVDMSANVGWVAMLGQHPSGGDRVEFLPPVHLFPYGATYLHE